MAIEIVDFPIKNGDFPHFFGVFPDVPHHSEENYGAIVAGAVFFSRACLHRPERGIGEQPLGTATMRGFQGLAWDIMGM